MNLGHGPLVYSYLKLLICLPSFPGRLHVFRKFLNRENDVSPSNVMEIKIDVFKQTKMTLRNISLDFTICYIGDQCLNSESMFCIS